jgi:hypothetical protein
LRDFAVHVEDQLRPFENAKRDYELLYGLPGGSNKHLDNPMVNVGRTGLNTTFERMINDFGRGRYNKLINDKKVVADKLMKLKGAEEQCRYVHAKRVDGLNQVIEPFFTALKNELTRQGFNRDYMINLFNHTGNPSLSDPQNEYHVTPAMSAAYYFVIPLGKPVLGYGFHTEYDFPPYENRYGRFPYMGTVKGQADKDKVARSRYISDSSSFVGGYQQEGKGMKLIGEKAYKIVAPLGNHIIEMLDERIKDKEVDRWEVLQKRLKGDILLLKEYTEAFGQPLKLEEKKEGGGRYEYSEDPRDWINKVLYGALYEGVKGKAISWMDGCDVLLNEYRLDAFEQRVPDCQNPDELVDEVNRQTNGVFGLNHRITNSVDELLSHVPYKIFKGGSADRYNIDKLIEDYIYKKFVDKKRVYIQLRVDQAGFFVDRDEEVDNLTDALVNFNTGVGNNARKQKCAYTFINRLPSRAIIITMKLFDSEHPGVVVVDKNIGISNIREVIDLTQEGSDNKNDWGLRDPLTVSHPFYIKDATIEQNERGYNNNMRLLCRADTRYALRSCIFYGSSGIREDEWNVYIEVSDPRKSGFDQWHLFSYGNHKFIGTTENMLKDANIRRSHLYMLGYVRVK